MDWPFVSNELYHRRSDIHGVYGGQQQSGIVTPANWPALFVFTGRGDKHGYADQWLSNGTLRYSGEGQVGPMLMNKGNRALRDHALNGRDILLFEKLGSGKPVRYIGQYVLASWCFETHPGRDGALRDAIIFDLAPLGAVVDIADGVANDVPASDILELFKRALTAAQPVVTGAKASRTVYQRSADVRSFVLARAEGHCEGCDQPAPFTTKSGMPYLEAHHIRRVSDGGPDHPDFVAATCPNCHRLAHHGQGAKALNDALLIRARSVNKALLGKLETAEAQ